MKLFDMSRKNIALLGTAAVLLLLSYAVHLYFTTRRMPESAPYYYSTDNGQTFFRMSDIRIPPFDHHGKKALEAGVYVDSHGKPFVAHVFTYSLAGQAILAGLPKFHGTIVDNDSLRMQASQYCLVRRPGHKKWVPWNSPQGQQIVTSAALRALL